MDKRELYGKRKKKLPKCPNPLFATWLREWQEEAAEKGAKSQYTYGKALKMLMKFPLRLNTGKDCKILQNFGDKICKMLDDRLQIHITEHGTDDPVDMVEDKVTIKQTVKKVGRKTEQGEATHVRRRPVAVHELSDSDSDDNHGPQQPPRKRQRSGNAGEKEYIPVYRTGPYALMMALYRHMQDPEALGHLSKADLIQKAQPLADKSFTLPDPGSRYTAWSSMGTLIKKGLVIKESSTAKYILTDKGCELAIKLEAVEANTDNDDDDSIPFRINEPDMAPLRNHVVPPQMLPRMHSSDTEDEGTISAVLSTGRGLRYWYITADDREVVSKDEALVTVEDDFGVGFLVKCNYTAVLRAGVRYKLDMTRPHRDDFCYLFLCNKDCLEVANPPYTHAALSDVPKVNNAVVKNTSRQATQSNRNENLNKQTVERETINNDKPKQKRSKPVKTLKPAGLQLLPLVNMPSHTDTATKPETGNGVYIDLEDDNSRVKQYSLKQTCKNVPSGAQHGVSGDSQESSQCSIKSLTDCSQSSTGSTMPDPDFVFYPGRFDIVLCVDNAEFYGAKGSSKTLLPDLIKNGIQCDLRKLHVGDLLWVAREKLRPLPGQLESPKGRELVLNYIIERKRMDDLVSSCIDGRFKEQKFRLKKCGLKNLIYLIEDYGSMQHFSLPEATIKQAITNTQVIDGFQVKRTKDTKETVAFLTVMTRYLQSYFQDKTLFASSLESIKEADITYSVTDTQQTLPVFEEFNQSSVKTKALTVREMFGKQLIQIHGMSADKALALTNRYPTPTALLKAYKWCTTEKEKECLLALIKSGKANRSLGSAQSKQIYQLYNINTALQ